MTKKIHLNLYEQFGLQIKIINEIINLKGEVRSLEPDIEDQFSKDFAMVGFKITEIKDADREILELLLS